MAGRQPVAAVAVAIDVQVNHVAAAAAAGAADVVPVVQWAAPAERCRVSQRWSVWGEIIKGNKRELKKCETSATF